VWVYTLPPLPPLPPSPPLPSPPFRSCRPWKGRGKQRRVGKLRSGTRGYFLALRVQPCLSPAHSWSALFVSGRITRFDIIAL
jgi:hypothetical protein